MSLVPGFLSSTSEIKSLPHVFVVRAVPSHTLSNLEGDCTAGQAVISFGGQCDSSARIRRVCPRWINWQSVYVLVSVKLLLCCGHRSGSAIAIQHHAVAHASTVHLECYLVRSNPNTQPATFGYYGGWIGSETYLESHCIHYFFTLA